MKHSYSFFLSGEELAQRSTESLSPQQDRGGSYPWRRSGLFVSCVSSNPESRFALDRSITVLSSRDYGIAFPAPESMS